jgi:endonuclease/exonuclease/phosphatase (EEP) superfamily protein YafD
MRVVSGNLYAFSEDQSPALRAVLDRDADVVVLVECRSSRPEAHLLEDPRYPYRAIGLPRANRLADGIAVVSRWPLSAVAHNPHFGLRMLVGTPQGPVTLMVLHAPTPLTPWHWRERQRLLSVLAAEAADVSGPLVVAGDWNCTEASHDWRLVSAAGLAGPAGLRTGTWPWLLGPLGIRIDHVLVKGLSLGSASTFAIPTSDHRGVEAVVGFAPSALDRSTYRAAP